MTVKVGTKISANESEPIYIALENNSGMVAASVSLSVASARFVAELLHEAANVVERVKSSTEVSKHNNED